MEAQKITRIIPLFLLAAISPLFSQFVEVNVKLDMRRLNEGDKELFFSIAEDIESYFLNTRFSPDAGDLEIIVDFHLVLEGVSQGGSETMVTAQAVLTNKMDQFFYAKGVQFPYSKGRRIIFSLSFSPLASFLDYYATLLIANELDTWDYMGGTNLFNKAEELADLGRTSDHSRGWQDRWKKARRLRDNKYLRSMRFHYFQAIDSFYAEEPDIKLTRSSLENFFDDLVTMDETWGSNKETLQFLDAYHREISELLAGLNFRDVLKYLAEYDLDNQEIYESYLEY